MSEHEKINYVEFPASNLQATKSFFITAFNWSFVDYGPDYTAFSNQGIDGGFFTSPLTSSSGHGAALVVLYSQDIEATQVKVEKAGCIIVKPLFSFPGGRCFHFSEPSGNELAVWSDIGI